MRRALITGITGQDGFYLAEFLHRTGYVVTGMVHDVDQMRIQALVEEMPFLSIVKGDLRSLPSLISAVEYTQPDEIYNLGGLSFIPASFRRAHETLDVDGAGVLRMLEAIRAAAGSETDVRFFQASTSEMFGAAVESPQNETTPFRPKNPYGAAKTFGHDIVGCYRDTYGMYAACGILYNHESPRRPIQYVTRKVTASVARIKLGFQFEIPLGDLDAERDWGFAGDYVRAMWLMLQQEGPFDYVIATGKTHTVRDLLEIAFRTAEIDPWQRYVTVDRRFIRPGEPRQLVGDATRAEKELGWRPTTTFEDTIAMMVEHDLKVEADRAARRA